MGEQPIFSTRAHVFQIDPNTKKSWLPCSTQAVTVSFYYDPIKETYRIISVDGSKAIVNSTVMPTMTFTKTSQKFGQWSDPRANTVYGLGFPSENELNKFADKFREAKGSGRPGSVSSVASSSSSTSGGGLPSNGGMTNGGYSSVTAAVNGVLDSPSRKKSAPSSIKSGSSSGNEDENRNTSSITHKPLGNTESQLRYENDRLKMALAQSSTNAKKWEAELQTLKNNNARLTAALQESTTNVEEWKKQLNAYKEESLKLRKKVQELESSDQKVEAFNALQNEKLTLEGQILQLENFVRQKDEEILNLRQERGDLNSQLEGMKLQKESLEKSNQELQTRLEQFALGSKVHDLSELQRSMADKIQELSSLNTLLASTLQSNPAECNSS